MPAWVHAVGAAGVVSAVRGGWVMPHPRDEDSVSARMDARLDKWALWARSGAAAGYPHRTVEARLRDEGGVLISGSGAWVEPTCESEEAVDRAVSEMPVVLREVVVLRYLVGLTDQQGAGRLRIGRTGYQDRLRRAYCWLDGRLAGVA